MENKIIVNNHAHNMDMAKDLPQENAFEIKCDDDLHKKILHISSIVENGGFDPVSQLAGFVLSEDPTHIANFNGARAMMTGIDRDELLEDMIRHYLGIEDENL